MLFDLKGKRRRVVQATYLTLAVLMGGGLVLFGIGGDVQGGLFDAFSDRKGQTDGNEVVEKRIARSEKALAADDKDVDARKQLVRDYFQLANAKADKGGNFSKSAKADLRKADSNWRAYIRSDPKKVDQSLSGLALQLYDPNVLNKPERARDAARLLARESDDTTGYLRLVQYAALAKDKRTISLATQKAVDLAPKDQRKLVRQQAKQFAKSAGQ